MKSTKLQILAAVAVAAAGSLAANADSVTLLKNTSQFSDSSGGGEFAASFSAPSPIDTSDYVAGKTTGLTGYSGDVQVFSAEVATTFTAGTAYSYTIGSTTTGDPVTTLTKGAAYLYYLFATGTLTGYNYTTGSGRTASALLLQQALWYLQGNQTSGNPAVTTSNNAFYAMAINKFGAGTPLNGAGAYAFANGAYGVEFLQLSTGSGYPKENQFICVPDGGSTMVMLGMGFTGIALAARRKK